MTEPVIALVLGTTPRSVRRYLADERRDATSPASTAAGSAVQRVGAGNGAPGSEATAAVDAGAVSRRGRALNPSTPAAHLRARAASYGRDALLLRGEDMDTAALAFETVRDELVALADALDAEGRA